MSGLSLSETSVEEGRRGPGRRALLVLFLVALALRLGALALLAPQRVAADGDAWRAGHEAACLAQSILRGGPYGDPWGKGSGASSWLTPPYPALVAACMALLGGVTPAAWLALFALQSLVSAATALLVVRLGRALGLARAALVAGWAFALYPPSVWNASQVVWDSTLVAFGLSGFLAAFLERARRGPLAPAGAAHLGLGFGALALLNPAPFTLAPVLLFRLAAGPTRGLACLRAPLAFGAVALAVCLPWSVRNWLVLGTFALRPNYGLELRLGNRDAASGHPEPDQLHPSHVDAEYACYLELGERGYSIDCARRALDWIRAHPADFAALTARRTAYFWLGDPPWLDRRSDHAGQQGGANAWWKFLAYGAVGGGAWLALLAARRALPERLFLAALVLAFGVPYYVTHVSERYRFPLDPLLVVLAAGGAAELGSAGTRSSRK